eukprot:scaffold111946_cov30-Tisochrysis_lutea.AAC.4
MAMNASASSMFSPSATTSRHPESELVGVDGGIVTGRIASHIAALGLPLVFMAVASSIDAMPPTSQRAPRRRSKTAHARFGQVHNVSAHLLPDGAGDVVDVVLVRGAVEVVDTAHHAEEAKPLEEPEPALSVGPPLLKSCFARLPHPEPIRCNVALGGEQLEGSGGGRGGDHTDRLWPAQCEHPSRCLLDQQDEERTNEPSH